MNLNMTKWRSRTAFPAAAGLQLVVAATAIALAQAPAPPANPESVKKAEDVLAAARNALGAQKLAGVKTIVASGRTRRVRGDNLVPIEFEILLELPDKYVRVDESPAEDTDPTSSGFNGEALIQIPQPPAAPAGPGRGMPPGGPGAPPADAAQTPSAPGRAAPAPGAAPGPAPAAPAAPGAGSATPQPPAGAPPGPQAPAPAAAPGAAPPGGRGMPGPGGRGPAMDPRRARIATVKQDFARLALGLFAASPAYPLTFSYAAIAEAPQGRADVLDVKGEGTFALRYFVNNETRLPIMVTLDDAADQRHRHRSRPATAEDGGAGRGRRRGSAGSARPAHPRKKWTSTPRTCSRSARRRNPRPVEHRLYFADYRDVDGLRLPFRLRRAIGNETTEETTFDRFRLNASIDPRKFEAVK